MIQRDVDTLEHESGLRPLGEFPDHCERCRRHAEMLARQAECTHEHLTHIRAWGGDVLAALCEECGATSESS